MDFNIDWDCLWELSEDKWIYNAKNNPFEMFDKINFFSRTKFIVILRNVGKSFQLKFYLIYNNQFEFFSDLFQFEYDLTCFSLFFNFSGGWKSDID